MQVSWVEFTKLNECCKYQIVGATLAVAHDECIPGSNNENHHLIKLAQEGLQQVDEKKYPENLKQHGISKILKVGIGFCGKTFELVSTTS